MSWIQDIFNPKTRQWEEFYRNRWQFDRVVRCTHGANCTGSCSWQVYVKDGIITWETQANDYPKLAEGMPNYEPRGCPRGNAASWYNYSPLRVKYPYMRGALLDLWREAKEIHKDPVAAWSAIMADETSRRRYQQARGKGGFRRVSWDEALELIAASNIYTIKKYGPDRIIGFSPIPAMSMVSFAGGSRFIQMMGGTLLSFYDWYCDLPNASPEIWGEQTDVAESADWFNSKYIVSMGSNLSMTRTPDVHFAAEARHNGAKMVVLSPDFSQVAKFADQWIPINAGQDGAFWMAVNHVILKEFHHEQRVPYFMDYVKKYTDSPFLVELKEKNGTYVPGQMLPVNRVERYRDEENGEFKYLVVDKDSGELCMPQGTLGFRWQKKKGQWNLDLKDGQDGSAIEPVLSMLENHDEVLQVSLTDFANECSLKRGIPVKYVETTDGKVPVATIYDLLMAQFGVGRGLPGEYPQNYDDDAVYTPAWQEKFTGIDGKNVIQFAREWATTAEKTNGKCMIAIGAGITHWYHQNLMYRAGIIGLMLCGCVGTNGGGLNHYVGQEKLAPQAPWASLAMALDWSKPPRLQNTPSFHYIHSGQWRYEGAFSEYAAVKGDNPLSKGHTIDANIRAVQMGWLPFYPQFGQNSMEVVREAEKAGATTNEEIVKYTVEQLKEKKLKFAIQDPDAPENWPRVWFIWRGNALMSSAKGQEYFFKHYLGTHSSHIAEEIAGDSVSEAVWREESPIGKLDLVVDLNFRMDTTALYSDIVLPAATWYEKDDLNSTDMHTFIHPLQEAVKPSWEAKTDWDTFKAFAQKVSELAKVHLPEPIKDVVAVPLQHDTPAEMAQRQVKEWVKGECEAIPGKTMPNLVVVERDYVNLYNRFISLGPKVKQDGIGMHGLTFSVAQEYDELAAKNPVEWNGRKYPSIVDAKDAANVILKMAPETNGEVAYRAFKAEEEKVGVPLMDLAEGQREVRMSFDALAAQPRRLLTTPCWTGITNNGRTYSAYCLNVERLVPWRTITGRQHLYLDHESYIAFGENLPTYKPKLDANAGGDNIKSKAEGKTIKLNYLTPHGKWQVHSTYYDNERMLTLSRGVAPFWINDKDAAELGLTDNDWIEVFNDHGVVVTRAVVSARLPKGLCMYYHSPERTISVPKSPLRGNKRAGGHNSLTRVKLKPVNMAGGYGQFTYGFNYWGPTGVNRDSYVMVRKLEGKPNW
jgi:nitrate reductase alpha subunit